MRSKTIKLHLLDGTPYGIRVAERVNWDGKIVIVPRQALKRVREMEEAERPAVYFLVGEEETIYVGQTQTLKTRINQHDSTKDFWHTMIALTSIKLTSTEVQYLEYFFEKKIREDGVANLINSIKPHSPTISKEEADTLEDFVDSASDILVSLGFDFVGVSHEVERGAKKGMEVYCKGPAAEATGIYGDGLLVMKGSKARLNAAPAFANHNYSRQREQLIANGILIEADGGKSLQFTADHLFSSPSAAAAIVLGRSADGRTEWKDKSGKSIFEIEDTER